MADAEEPETNFEQALGELERIVAVLERGDTPLAEALTRYEQGVRLLARCHHLLDSAEQTVALLTDVDEAGSAQTAPFDATATAERERPAPRKPRTKTPVDDDGDGAPF